jgi:alkylation response protein AidB-like acyl-CoA dehydrogenase
MLDFSLTCEQEELKENSIEFARKANSEDIFERDKSSQFSKELWQKYANFGVQGLIAPQCYGGLDLDLLSCVAIMEGLGYGSNDSGILFSINAHIWSCVCPILEYGTEQQKNTYLPDLCTGKLIGVHAMTEPQSGSDAFSMKTKAHKINNKYIINGVKTFITNGSIADIILVFVKSDNIPNILSCLLVKTDTPGVTCSQNIEKMGLRTSPFCQIYFDDCVIPEENLIGDEGMGRQIFSHAMDGERALILATQIGMMEKQLDDCVSYVKLRKQFSRPIFEFQSISNMLADMKVRLETSRLLLYKVAWMKDKGRNATQESAMAKLYISECAIQNSMSAMRIFGGSGYTVELGMERQMRDSLGGLFYSGTSEIMRNIISELLD